MIRPLYLDAALPWQIKLDDGPSLHVCAPGRARSLYPLRRLARVVCPTDAQWTTAALIACLRAGVSVTFHDAAGETVAWCFGPRKRETTLGSLLRQTIGEPRGAEWIAAWYRAAQRSEILAVTASVAACRRGLDPLSARAFLCNVHRDRLEVPVGRWLHALRCANAAFVAQCLHDLVGDPSLIGFPREGLHVGKAVASLMEWRLHEVIHRSTLRDVLDHSPGRFGADAVEREGVVLHRACAELMGRLEHHLRGELT